MRTADFDYELPEELIAKFPAKKREKSQLLVFGRRLGKIDHRTFEDITEYIREGDLLVLNDSRVFKARLFGKKEGTGGEVELLCLHSMDGGNTWKVICKPARRIRTGTVIAFDIQHSATVRDELKGGETVSYTHLRAHET